MWSLIASLALAAPLRLPASPSATAAVLPGTTPGRIDILVHDREADLQRRAAEPPDGVRAMRAIDLGGTWVVTLWPENATAQASVVRERDTWLVQLTTSATAPLGPARAVATAPANADAIDPGCGDVPAVPLVPLHGADMLHVFPFREFAPTLPTWGAAEPTETSWARVDALRGRLYGASAAPVTPSERAAALYELGALHRDLGHAREAAYYFGAADAAGVDGGLAALQRAGALLRAADWDGAAAGAVAASRGGAPEASALEIEAIAALFGTTEVAGTGVAGGRALAAGSSEPDASLVAGALLLRSACFADARAPLERAVTSARPERSAMARLLLGDALVLAGDLDAADKVIGALSEREIPPRWGGILRSRNRLRVLLREGPERWPASLPTLERAAAHWDEEGAEALFLLGQLGAHLGDERLSLDSWTALVDRRRGPATGEPARRLFEAWRGRVTSLLAAGRDADALAVHAGAWRPGLAVWLDDPAPLRAVAAADERLGLNGPALDVLTLVADVEGRRGLDDRATILEIAGLYRATNQLAEAVEALDFLAARPPDPVLDGRARVLRARVLDQRGDRDGARAMYVSVAAPPEAAAEGAIRAALIDADLGRCADALPVLGGDIVALPDGVSRGLLDAARARCLAGEGRTDESRVAARGAAAVLTNPDAVALATWLAGDAPPRDAAPLWTRLRDADSAWNDLKARVRNPSSAGATVR